MFYVYLLHSVRDAGLYIGYSSDLRRRLSEHQEGASRATSYRGPWKLIYYEAYTEEADAIGRERYLKRAGLAGNFCGHSFAATLLNIFFEPRETEPRPRGEVFYAG